MATTHAPHHPRASCPIQSSAHRMDGCSWQETKMAILAMTAAATRAATARAVARAAQQAALPHSSPPPAPPPHLQ
eukprot:scaffold43371_cov61-Phaeocystis_antarctica.AAC.1